MKKKKNKCIQSEKIEVKLSQFADHDIVYR